MGFHELSDIILIVNIARKPFNLVIIQVYVPRYGSPEEKIAKVYDDFDVTYKLCGGQHMRIDMGDLKTSFGKY